MIGFGILFGLALICRLISYSYLKKQYEPKIKLKKGYYFSFLDFVKQSPKNNFGKFAIYRAIFTFAVAITSALLAIYFLRFLGFSYFEYMLITLSGTTIALFTLGIWGKILDKYGSYRIICVASIILPIVPILWVLHSSLLYLIFVPSLVSGIGWAGFHLAERNFIYDNVGPQKRGLAISYYNMFWGIGTFFGAILGGILIKYLHTNLIAPIIIIFIIGAIVRMLSVFWILPLMKEVKGKKGFKNSKVFREIILKQAKPTISEEIHELIHIKKYLDLK